MLQLALERSGFLTGPPDGVFGSKTHAAVLAFQRVNGLSLDGIVGARTWAALEPWLTGYITATAKYGDTFFRLAQIYGTSPAAIQTANPSVDPKNIRVGSRITVPLGFPVVPVNVPYTYALLNYCIRGLNARYPFIRTGAAGKSIMGRQLFWLRLGSGDRALMYNASHHANEWLTTPVLMKFAEDFARAASSGEALNGLNAAETLRLCSLWLLPMVNPDGVDLVTGAIPYDSPYFARAARIAADYPGIPFTSGWKANIFGTDLNLQYPAGWEEAKRIKYELGFSSPAPANFVGTAPLTAPESAAVYRFSRERDFLLTLSYHTQGKVIFWKYLDTEPPGAREIGEDFARSSGYALESTPYASAYAGYKDWFISAYDRPGYTIECGLGENPLPISQFGEIYENNLGILTGALTASLTL